MNPEILKPNADPTLNVREMINDAVDRIDDLREREVKRLDGRIDANDDKYKIQFDAAKEAVGIALIAQEKSVAQALEGTKEAINKAEQANEKRFDAVNEFSSTLADQQAKLLPRIEYESNHKSLIDKIDAVESRINRTEGASGVYVTHTDLATEMEKLRLSFESMLRPVVTFMNSQTGKSQGYNSGWLYLIGAISLLSTIISVFHALTE